MFTFTCFFFNDTATTEIYTLSLHDALPILHCRSQALSSFLKELATRGLITIIRRGQGKTNLYQLDRKSTRLNSSHANISYAVFCLKKKKATVERVSFC